MGPASGSLVGGNIRLLTVRCCSRVRHARIKAGIYLFKMPARYRTNSTDCGSWTTQGITRAPDLAVAMEQIKEPLEYLSSQLNRRGDLAAATVVRCCFGICVRRHETPL